MIINDAPANEVTLSGVGKIGEFTIKATAKSFQILSSGLYANKIRAVIREYSCNALDSHIEAGNVNTPFDVHLPSSLEPWFAVRDYGVGLSDDQVNDIYTSFFESTKTRSNELIGALGLGSKSAFSLTDNFTVTAIKNGRKGIYTAFINENGVPSIALMAEEETTEPTGVEIRFGVEDTNDFYRFSQEAQHVFKHFKHRPVVAAGGRTFDFINPDYTEMDIIPGVHLIDVNRHHGRAVAIMGNIEYMIDIPSSSITALGELKSLLTVGLVMEFGIGELDIQPSREGLSYIPSTIASIKKKLEEVNASLAKKIEEKVSPIKNNWEKAYELARLINIPLWSSAAHKYATDTKFALITDDRWARTKEFMLDPEDIAKKCNIKINAFTASTGWGTATCSNIRMEQYYDAKIDKYVGRIPVSVSARTMFVVNDTTIGAMQRAKHHWRQTVNNSRESDSVYVLEKLDRKKEMDTKKFFKLISSPPASQILNASSLTLKERAAGIGTAVSILKLEKRDNKGYARSNDLVWRSGGNLSSFDASTTYYYLPISGFSMVGEARSYNMSVFIRYLREADIITDTIYGVRKSDLEEVAKKSNWVNVDEYVKSVLAKPGSVNVMGVVKKSIDFDRLYKYTSIENVSTDSPYCKFYNEFKDVKEAQPKMLESYKVLCSIYKIEAGNVKVTDIVDKYRKESDMLLQRYPLLNELSGYCRNGAAVAEYINAIDNLKK